MQSNPANGRSTAFPEEAHCKYCEKFILEIELQKNIGTLSELPGTYDPSEKKHVWRDKGIFAYAIIPQSFHGKKALIDVYICIDEDDLDDIEIGDYLEKFLKSDILPKWGVCTSFRLAGPHLTPPAEIGCWHGMHRHDESAGR